MPPSFLSFLLVLVLLSAEVPTEEMPPLEGEEEDDASRMEEVD